VKTAIALLRRHALAVALAIGWFLLFRAGFQHYAGSKALYVGFSLVSLALLLNGFYRPASFSYLFLSIFLWLGFWFKLTANFLFLGFFPFGEAVGSFDSSPRAWDQVLYVAMVASISVILARGLLAFFGTRVYSEMRLATPPPWYPKVRRRLWLFLVLAILAAAVLNVIYGVHQIGISPRTIFPWPTNALLAWFLNLGAALAISILVCWDVALRKNLVLPAYAMLGEAFLMTVSIISRAAFPFHIIPQMLALWQRQELRQRVSKVQLLFFLAIVAIFFLTAVASVSVLRDYLYSGNRSAPVPTSPAASPAVPPTVAGTAEIVKPVASFRWILIHQLVINRWIGIEGVMAIASYPEKSTKLLKDMLLEKREIGKVTAYQLVSNSGYQVPDAKYQFGSMPGMAGFLYYGGSLWIVFFAMFGIVLFAIASERAVFAATANPVFCSLYGVTLANTIAQFGVTPRQDISMFLMLYAVAGVVWVIQSSARE
jgi:hypothetical protein